MNPFFRLRLPTLFAAWLAPGRSQMPAGVVSALCLLGGIANALISPAPAWFSALDLRLAFLPMAWLALHLVTRRHRAEGGV